MQAVLCFENHSLMSTENCHWAACQLWELHKNSLVLKGLFMIAFVCVFERQLYYWTMLMEEQTQITK